MRRDIIEEAKYQKAAYLKMCMYAPDSVANQYPECFSNWQNNVNYLKNDRVQRLDKLYRALEDNFNELPENNVKWIDITNLEIKYKKWKQPQSHYDAYNKSDCVRYNGINKISKIDLNVYSPDDNRYWDNGLGKSISVQEALIEII